MLYVASVLGLALSNVAIVVAFTQVLRSRDRLHARERDLLVNQICHLSGRAWNDPPSHQPEPEVERDWANTWESQAPEQMVA